MEYEWDDNKNQIKHSIDFYDAILIFNDNDRIELLDDRKDYQEKRYRTIGTVYDVVLTVIYTIRNNRYRIISARKASKHERKTYYHKKL